jgi:membrane protease YdiL (CAAX protease family)
MAASEPRELFEQVPDWWSESVLGLSVALAGVAGMGFGTMAVGRAAGTFFGADGTTFESLLPYGLTLLSLAVVAVAVGVGVTYAYLAYREFDPGFVVAWPDRAAVRWLAGLAALGPALIGVGTLGERLVAPTGGWEVPGAYLAVNAFGTGPGVTGESLLVGGALSIAFLAGVVGPTVGALLHGVLQNSLRRAAPVAVAVGGTALVAAVVTNGTDPAGTVIVAVVVAVAGYAYERTGNLAVPMAAYAVLNAVTLTTALLLVLSAAGQL